MPPPPLIRWPFIPPPTSRCISKVVLQMHRALAKQLRIDPLSNLYGQPREQRALGLWVDLDLVTFRGLWWRRHWPSGWRQWHRGVFAQRYIGAAGVIVDAGLAEDVFLKVNRGGVVLVFAAKALQKPRHDAHRVLWSMSNGSAGSQLMIRESIGCAGTRKSVNHGWNPRIEIRRFAADLNLFSMGPASRSTGVCGSAPPKQRFDFCHCWLVTAHIK